MRSRISAALLLLILTAAGCIRRVEPKKMPDLHVAGAANLTRVLPELARNFEQNTGIHVVLSYGATSQLAQQIENGAPFDVFLSADLQHVDELIRKGFAVQDSRGIYARGQLVVWAPKRPDLRTLASLAGDNVRTIAIAKPELAPYGQAAVETLKKAQLWDKVQSRVAYASSVAIARQYADTGNADAAFTALSLIMELPGNYFVVDESMHAPINQGMCVIKSARGVDEARVFTSFLSSRDAKPIWKRFGYVQQ